MSEIVCLVPLEVVQGCLKAENVFDPSHGSLIFFIMKKNIYIYIYIYIMNLRIFMLCVKIRKCETFSIRSNSAMRNGP